MWLWNWCAPNRQTVRSFVEDTQADISDQSRDPLVSARNNEHTLVLSVGSVVGQIANAIVSVCRLTKPKVRRKPNQL
jgi:hypothetical protein